MQPPTYPDDLVQAQRHWNTTYQALAAVPRPQNTTALRRRLQQLSVRIWWHPFWSTSPGGPRAGRVELGRLARADEQQAPRSA
ncbi:hypothetical protein [Streptomyces syringium]|uniref:hypothetical protein n=1 Tax=Streptomyces syringium TaxID=76729 RepID=UPI0033BBF007